MDVIEPPSGLDLSPAPAPPPRTTGRRRWLPTVVIVLVLVGAGYVVSKALTSAALFFYTADEAVAKKAELGTRQFRIEGTVENDIHTTSRGADFTITYNGVEVPVDHVGDPPELFKPGEPVVLEGHWDPSNQRLFDSNLMLVKHDATYTAKNSGRLKQAVGGGNVAPKSSTTSTTNSSGSGNGSSGTP
jgi:cytochrome c-type biogenesis protein CcmE